MRTLKKVAGNPNSPVPGLSAYQNDVLVGSKLHYVIIDNVPQNDMIPNPDYSFNSTLGTFDFTPNTFQLGMKIIFVYSNCQC